MRGWDVLIELWELLGRTGIDAAVLHGRTPVEELCLDDETRRALREELAQRLGCPLVDAVFDVPTLNDVIDAIVRTGREHGLG